MHDINTIERKNYEAFQRAVGNFQAQGRYVLCTYEGLHLVSIETFSTADELVDAHSTKVRDTPAGQGAHFKCLQPTAGFHATQRDQSEDRPQRLSTEELAALSRTGEAESLHDIYTSARAHR
jgi:hypothetical protein